MKQTIAMALGIGALAALAILGTATRGETQAGPASLSIGIYTPSVAFANSQDRLRYVQRLSKAVEQATGASRVVGRSFSSFTQLKKARVDFAIVDAQCVAVNPRWDILATAEVGGKTSQAWGLYSSQGDSMLGLRGKKLSYVKTGCQDESFVFNAMLDSEVDKSFFGGTIGKPDVPGAVAEVASYKGAQAVFAPAGSQKGLNRVFTATSVPTPGFVVVNDDLPKSVVDNVRGAVVGYGGGGAISGWARGDSSGYSALRAKMRRRSKRPVFAAPPPVRIDSRDILVDPDTLDRTDVTSIGQHFERPDGTL